MRLVRQRPQCLLIRTVFCQAPQPFVLQISSTTRVRLALTAYSAHVAQYVTVNGGQLVLRQAGMRETPAKRLNRIRGRKSQRTELRGPEGF